MPCSFKKSNRNGPMTISQLMARVAPGTVRRLRTQKFSIIPLIIQPGRLGTKLACRLVGQLMVYTAKMVSKKV